METNVTRATITISAAELEEMILDAAKEQFLDEYDLNEGEKLDAEVLSAIENVVVNIAIHAPATDDAYCFVDDYFDEFWL